MPRATLTVSHWESDPDAVGEGSKDLINYYPELNGQDQRRPIRLVTTPGSVDNDTGNVFTSDIRGLHQADNFASGDIIVTPGTAVYRVPPGGTPTALTGTTSGTGCTQAAFAQSGQAALLAGGSLYTLSGSAVTAFSDADWATQLSNHSQSVFTSIATIGQRLLATYGSRFAYSDSGDFGATGVNQYYTAESSPDDLVAVRVLDDRIVLFGTQTVEFWTQTGQSSTSQTGPFQRAQGTTLKRGAVTSDLIVQVDNALYFMGDDRNIYELRGYQERNLTQADPWVVRHLKNQVAGNMVMSFIQDEAHTFVLIWSPTKCIVYDLQMSAALGRPIWHLRQSYDFDTWRWKFHQRVGQKHFAAGLDTASTTRGYVELKRDVHSEYTTNSTVFGEHIQRVCTAFISVDTGKRPPVGSIRLEGSKGVGDVTGSFADPSATLWTSNDNGNTWLHRGERALGKTGEYFRRTIWRQNGRLIAPQKGLRFRVTDAVAHSVTGVVFGED